VADKRWQADRLRGVYLQVVSPGVVAPGDRIEVLKRR
jgi:MOSC domain-containing protein YiiM